MVSAIILQTFFFFESTSVLQAINVGSRFLEKYLSRGFPIEASRHSRQYLEAVEIGCYGTSKR